jgi:NAD(P)H-dependent FMN reductase
MQVSGGSQSFNAVNTLRLQGRCVRMITIPNQSSVTEAFMEFDEDGRMKPSTATIVSPLDENSGHAASTICATRPASLGDLQRHAGHRIGRSTTQVIWVKQESIS